MSSFRDALLQQGYSTIPSSSETLKMAPHTPPTPPTLLPLAEVEDVLDPDPTPREPAKRKEKKRKPEIRQVHQPIQTGEDVTFITPYTEVTVLCQEVYRDSSVFCIITDASDRTKVRPARGVEMSVRLDTGEEFKIFSSGVYVPIRSLSCTLSVFFVLENEAVEE